MRKWETSTNADDLRGIEKDIIALSNRDSDYKYYIKAIFDMRK